MWQTTILLSYQLSFIHLILHHMYNHRRRGAFRNDLGTIYGQWVIGSKCFYGIFNLRPHQSNQLISCRWCQFQSPNHPDNIHLTGPILMFLICQLQSSSNVIYPNSNDHFFGKHGTNFNPFQVQTLGKFCAQTNFFVQISRMVMMSVWK